MTIAKCKTCNADLKPEDKFCFECGAVVVAQTAPQLQSHPAPNLQQQVREQQVAQPPQQQPYQTTSQPHQPQTFQSQPQAAGSAGINTEYASTAGVQAMAASPASTAPASVMPDAKKSKDNTQLGVFGYVITMLALSVPILGIILVFVWAFGANTNLARKNYCRGVLVLAGIFLVLTITVLIVNFSALMELTNVLAG